MTETGKKITTFFLILGFYALIAFFFMSGKLILSIWAGKSADLTTELYWNLIRWVPWALFTPVIVALVRRFPMHTSRWPWHIPLHLVFALILNMLHTVIYYFFEIPIMHTLDMPFSKYFISMNFKIMHYNVLIYGATIAVIYLLSSIRQVRERELPDHCLGSRGGALNGRSGSNTGAAERP